MEVHSIKIEPQVDVYRYKQVTLCVSVAERKHKVPTHYFSVKEERRYKRDMKEMMIFLQRICFMDLEWMAFSKFKNFNIIS